MSRIIAIIWIVLGVCHAAAQDVYLQNRRAAFRQVAAVPGGVGTDPTNVAGLYAQWVADDIGLADGAAVSNWTDRVSAWTVSQLTNAAYMPYATNNVWNGHDALYFSSDVLFLSNTVFASYWAGQDMPYTMFIVAKRANTNATYVFSTVGTNSQLSGQGWRAEGVYRVYDVAGSYTGTATNDTLPHVYTFVDHGITVSSFIDEYKDIDNVSANNTLMPAYFISIGAYLSSGGNWSSLTVGHIAEVLVYTNAVSGANVTNIVDFLVDKYGITPF